MARRSRPTRDRQKRCFVVCDGETEKNYFDYVLGRFLNDKRGIQKKLTIKTKIGIHPDHAKRELCRARENYDCVIFLCDLERPNLVPGDVQRIRNFAAEVKSYNSRQQPWHIFYNMPSIEYWYILHCECCTRAFPDSRAAENHLRRNWLPEYEKPMPRNCTEAEFFLAKVDDALQNNRNAQPLGQLRYSIPSCRDATNPYSALKDIIKILLDL
ncbi:RloB family protein [Pseudodesulfovibrio tunisiensis]|uniref:RloB family protein n=1 Tax=Pseudodesulfovibrio tunisiensis TaxID=463192 RepID=UPI001FB51FAE|nr:RloB family protein [Pseudodesulfovibrio tunisiensis]